MSVSGFSPRIHLIIEVRKKLDRRAAAQIIREDLETGPPSGEFWQTVSMIASQLGEIELSIEAAKRFAATAPRDMDHVFYYAYALLRYGRIDEALRAVGTLSASDRAHPGTLHFRAVATTQKGDFDDAERFAREAIAISPAPVQWLALSVAKKFKPGDPDIAQMEAVLPRVGRAPAEIKSQLLYALGKAYDDIKDYEKATWAYGSAAAIMRAAMPVPNAADWNAFVTHLISGYTPQSMAELTPSGEGGERMLFVTGFPRSGTTLVEQILTSHSRVKDGAELNLVPVAMIPATSMESDTPQMFDSSEQTKSYLTAGDFLFEDAMAYQRRSDSTDPWGDLGRDYLQMATERFGADGMVVDKTLNLGSFMGLLLHTLPKAKVFWLRRKPEDCALSIFRMYAQPGTLPWTHSFTDIAHFFRAEDQLYAHWTRMFPDRILTVPYEQMVSDPQTWIRKILRHAELPEEPQVFEPHKSTRAVSTASMAQVRQPISTARIGAAESYKTFMEEFRKAYYGQ
jgi:tetratricopeptide (TPR) repeat protein